MKYKQFEDNPGKAQLEKENKKRGKDVQDKEGEDKDLQIARK